MSRASSSQNPSIAVLFSGHGRGTNLQNLMDACASGEIEGHIAIVIGTRSDSPALDRARHAGLQVVVISPRKYADDEAGYAQALLRTLQRHSVDLICLAGYMLHLPTEIVATFRDRVMNVHPALLPLFGGQGMFGENVHRAVLESGVKVSGCTVHFVDEQYDTGPIIAQTAVSVEEEDTPSTLAARVLQAEYQTYVRAVKWFCEGRLHVEGHRVRIQNKG